MTTNAQDERTPDADLWRLVCEGSQEAFERLVRRHQSLVCAVAYGACGDFSLSEDVAQETFWTAWRTRATLERPGMLRPWLCGIARNLGKNAVRRASRPAEPAAALDDVSADEPDPAEEAVSREEGALIWQALEQVPETYREPLILFYREDQSVAEVASALDLSEDAVKQRLSRGRAMLRGRIAELVEGGLRRTRPGRGFTVAVMTALATGSAGAKAAMGAAGGAAAGKAAAAAGVAGGTLGAVLGPLIGLGGGWLGTWIPAQLARTRRDRDLLRKTGRRMLVVSLLFMGLLLAVIWAFAGRQVYLALWLAWFVGFEGYIAVETIVLVRTSRRICAEEGPGTEPNDAPLRLRVLAVAARYRGRVFRSRATLLGWPLIDIQVRDPFVEAGSKGAELGRARGWIAIGDEARGLLLAIARGSACGLVAIGGRSLGVVSLGGMAFGLVASGGLAVGLLALGGLGVGGIAIGGGAVGWQAAGGGAVAWDVACGGGAIARHAAFGGLAVARDFAVGGDGWAAHFNDPAAKAVLLQHPLKLGMDWYIGHVGWVTAGIIAIAVVPSCVVWPLMYRRSWDGEAPPVADPGSPSA